MVIFYVCIVYVQVEVIVLVREDIFIIFDFQLLKYLYIVILIRVLIFILWRIIVVSVLDVFIEKKKNSKIVCVVDNYVFCKNYLLGMLQQLV